MALGRGAATGDAEAKERVLVALFKRAAADADARVWRVSLVALGIMAHESVEPKTTAASDLYFK